MERLQTVPGNGRRRPAAEPVAARSELDELRVACRRQVHVIEMLGGAVSALRVGAAALKAENVELRAAYQRVREPRGAWARADAVEALEVTLPLDARAPRAARIVVEGLRGRVPTSVIDDALLVATELVTNSVRHSGAVVVIRVQITSTMLRLEVEDPGSGGTIAPRAPDLESGGGFGLNLVRALSERWGLERAVAGGTCVWAQLRRAPSVAHASAFAGGARSS
jgi:anti-sigma regulatory factor (Ser/Thr protein kinase)